MVERWKIHQRWSEPRRWRVGVDWPYRWPVPYPSALVDDRGRVVLHRQFEGVGGRPVVVVQVWQGSLEDFMSCTGQVPVLLAGSSCVAEPGTAMTPATAPEAPAGHRRSDDRSPEVRAGC